MSLDISCESSAKQMIHLKCQDLHSLKIAKKKKKKKNQNTAVVVIGAFMVKKRSKLLSNILAFLYLLSIFFTDNEALYLK